MVLLLRIALVFAVLFAASGLYFAFDWWKCLPEHATAEYVGRSRCVECHPVECEEWTGSDHDLAMDVATEETVLADFGDVEYTHFEVTSRFFRENGGFFVTTDNRDGEMETFEVKYVFGVRPLQQYMVEFPDGRVQCLPLAWDTQKKEWFHLYPDEPIPHDDELHWTGPLQNWNYMCAECHSTNLRKNYDLATNTYHTTFSEIDVSCEACHGPCSLHCQLAEAWSPFWDRKRGMAVAATKADSQRTEIENCAPCHSRRRIVHPGCKPGKPFLDYYFPELIDGDLYYADGQILEEDYVYGSFIQSRMYHEEVRCTDCHNPHSLKVKFDDNRLCGQCHVPAQYDTPTHHFHPDSSKPGTLCVECHMPETTYMVVDPRRDHSLRVPRPDLTVELGIPNACTGCHHEATEGMDEKTAAEWAQAKVEAWYGPPKPGPPHFAHAIAAGREGKPEGEPALLAVARRRTLPASIRASAILLLGRYGTPEALSAAYAGLDAKEPLIRAASVRALEMTDPRMLHRRVTDRLDDPVRAVRTEAARVLSVVPRNLFNKDETAAFDAALEEYMEGQRETADQAAAHLNMAVIHANQGREDEAVDEYEIALRLDPRFVPAYLNLAMLHYHRGNAKDAERHYRTAMGLAPEMGEIPYSLALLLAENSERLSEVAELLGKAAELAPENARIHYNLGLTLMRLEKPVEAERALRAAYNLQPSSDFLEALATLYAQEEQWAEAITCAEELLRRDPGNRRHQGLLELLKRSRDPEPMRGRNTPEAEDRK